MASSMPPLSSTLSELQPPDSSERIRRTFAGYRQALATMTQSQLLAELSQINLLLEQQRSTILSSALDSGPLSGYLEGLDRVQLRSTEPEPRSSPPRGRAAQASQPSLRQSPLDLLAASAKLGPRLARKLVAASARASARR